MEVVLVNIALPVAGVSSKDGDGDEDNLLVNLRFPVDDAIGDEEEGNDEAIGDVENTDENEDSVRHKPMDPIKRDLSTRLKQAGRR